MSPQTSLVSVRPNNIVVATIKSHAAGIVGKVGGISTEIMLDSGSSVSLLSQDTAVQLTGATSQPLPHIQLQTASGEALPIMDYVSVDVQLNKMKTSVCHNFIIVSSLIAPVILGIDFFQQHHLILDFTLNLRSKARQHSVSDLLSNNTFCACLTSHYNLLCKQLKFPIID